MAHRLWVTALFVAFCRASAWADVASLPATDGDEAATIASSREMLNLLGVGDRLEQAADGADFAVDGDELLWRSLTAVRRISLLDLDRWKLGSLSFEAVRNDPSKYRGSIVSWSGTVTLVRECKLPPEAAERFDLQHYYRCELELADDNAHAIVYALAVPKEWLAKETLPERAAVEGLFVRLADDVPELESDDSMSRPVLVARRVAWHPRTMLGDLDMDVGLFDELSTKPEVTGEDRECFYQLLAAVGRAPARQLSRAVPQEGRNASVVPLFNQPDTQRGRLVELTGTARQAVERRVEDRDIVARFGIDHYFELEVFTPDSQNNPLTFCVRELPREFPQGAKITEPVRVAGFFFKRWGYRTSAADAKTGNFRRQLAPLLIGREPVWIEPPQVDQRFANGVFLVLFVVLTGVLWLVVSRLSRGDVRFQKQLERRFGPPPPVSLNEIALDENDPGEREA
jgi:hypothetical protein